MGTTPEVLKGTSTVWALTIEVRRPHSGAYVVLTAKAVGKADVEHLVALQLCGTPVSQDVMAEFESDILCSLEDSVARLVGLQELLGLG